MAAGRQPTTRRPGRAATVVRVVDGDTIVVRLGDRTETVRLIGIDTPESVARDRPDECYGAEASSRLAELLPPGTAVQLTRDVEPRDMYDRLLAYVHRPDDGLFVNLAQVADGYAERSPTRPTPPTAVRSTRPSGRRAAGATPLVRVRRRRPLSPHEAGRAGAAAASTGLAPTAAGRRRPSARRAPRLPRGSAGRR